ncbi:exopolysaccharide biosynthesis polyprenyl glycosylphosphotransferase [Halomonas alkaliantarctica]|nr:exopolysaccharide biosynthesis polyprenyl glycosylphosphotransferase [Halomonas alkaliantarctica]
MTQPRYQRRHSRWYEVILLGLPFQLIAGVIWAVLLPSLERWGWGFWQFMPDYRSNTVIATALATLCSLLTLRHLIRFPSVRQSAYIWPTVTVVFLIIGAMFLFTREAYTRQVLFHSYLMTLLWCYAGYFMGRRYRRLKFAIVPFGKTHHLIPTRQADFRFLSQPDLTHVRVDGVVADLRAQEIPPQWEHFLADCTLNWIPVYHVRQIQESLSGRVEIDHLSENEFGSLLPSRLYTFAKRLIDTVAALLLLPLLTPLMLVIALLIRLDSPGPALFVQTRVGYRARAFRMVKFRTMYAKAQGSAFTQEGNDPRITRVGHWLRKYRLDELPQIINVLKGEMSFIGPRPESLTLSCRYTRTVPFFSYRHVVKPGITGWAQVEQGYAAERDAMLVKLQYDFYYIKHYSLWLDILIAFKTLRIIATGFGSR